MVTLVEAFLRQCEMLLIGFTLLSIRYCFENDQRSFKEMIPDDLRNPYFVTYLVVLWFGFFTCFTWCTNAPRFGIWSIFFQASPILGWIVIGLVVIGNIVLILWNRYRNTQ